MKACARVQVLRFGAVRDCLGAQVRAKDADQAEPGPGHAGEHPDSSYVADGMVFARNLLLRNGELTRQRRICGPAVGYGPRAR